MTRLSGNIASSRPDAQFEEIAEVAKAARCDESIKLWPEGYKTKVEKVSRLSGGERHRISNCSRNFERCASCCSFDDGNGSVDSENEAEIHSPCPACKWENCA